MEKTGVGLNKVERPARGAWADGRCFFAVFVVFAVFAVLDAGFSG
jgi:hypothetical protein